MSPLQKQEHRVDRLLTSRRPNGYLLLSNATIISRMKKGIILKRLSELSGTASDPGYDHRHKPDSSYHIGLAAVTSSGNKDGNRRDTTAKESGHLTESPIEILAAQGASAKRDSFKCGLPHSLLQSHNDRDCVAPIMLHEINFGPKLGSGEFSNVYEIESFNLQDDHACVKEGDKSVEEMEKRHFLKKYEKYRQTKKPRYAVKHLKGDYFRDHDADTCIQAVR